jgi:hypothetical protein
MLISDTAKKFRREVDTRGLKEEMQIPVQSCWKVFRCLVSYSKDKGKSSGKAPFP